MSNNLIQLAISAGAGILSLIAYLATQNYTQTLLFALIAIAWLNNARLQEIRDEVKQ